MIRRIGRLGVLYGLILIAATALIALIWGFTISSVDTEEREARAHAESNVANLARTIEWQLTRQLQSIDQAMQLLAVERRNDPARFDPVAWKRRSTLLNDAALQLSVLDATGAVISTTRPELQGVDMSDRDYFQAQRNYGRAGLFVGAAIRWKQTGRWEINLSRRLEREDGGFAGVLVVSYDPFALTSRLEQVDLGARGLIALLGVDGAIRALASPTQMGPGEDISGSAMFRQATAQGQVGTWTGPSAPDGVVRIHAFRRLREQDLTIVVGIDSQEAMRSAVAWAVNARIFAGGISLIALLIAGLLTREVRAARGRENRLANDRRVLEDAYAELEDAKARADAKTGLIETTLSGMSDGVMMLDHEMRLVHWNARFADYTGVPNDMLRVGTPMEDLIRAQARMGEFGPVDPEAEVKRRVVLLRNGRAFGVHERQRPDGRTVELRRSVLPDGGVVTLYTDITARKQVEAAHAAARLLSEEATEQKSRFVAIVSHEIRTPLNAVVNSLALLDQSGLSPVQHRLADTARQAGDALLDLINDILELSKMGAGRLALRPTVFDPRPVLEGVQDMFRAQAEARGIDLRLEVAADLPRYLRGDIGRMRQVLMNFVSNAVKFSLPGQVLIRAVTVTLGGKLAVMLSVRDQGPRIPEQEATKLFSPFSRLANARDTGTPGTGLGLAICERLTRLMGGQIGIGPAPTGGNEFWFTLPIEDAAGLQAPAQSGDVISLSSPRRATILLVEDIPANHLVTATLLRRDGHRVDIAESGQEAIRLARERPYDMIFMDVVMPGMNGYEAARRIRALGAPAGTVPIVALTANTAPEDRARCIAAGMNEMIGKPVRPAELAEVIARSVWPMQAASGVKDRPLGDEVSSIDEERLSDLRRGLPASTLISLVEHCLTDMHDRMPRLREALTLGQPGPIEDVAHALAGMAATYGLAAVERRMRRITAAARRNDVVAATVAAEEMDGELVRAGEAIRTLLHEKAA